MKEVNVSEGQMSRMSNIDVEISQYVVVYDNIYLLKTGIQLRFNLQCFLYISLTKIYQVLG